MILALSPCRERFKPSGCEIHPLTFAQMEVVSLFQPWLNREGGGVFPDMSRLPVSASMREDVAGATRCGGRWFLFMSYPLLTAAD